jgi:LmbE family N-acetylglucosaminyl deacetylase
MRPISRRGVLGGFGGVAGAVLAEASQDDPVGARRQLKVVVAGGHPGDPEYGCGGTVARYTALGHEVVLLYLNEGAPPGRPLGPDRVAEAKAACAILGARPRFAGQVDGRSVVDSAHADAFLALLEAERPDVLFTHWPIDNHADHRATAMLCYDAWLRSGRRAALYFYEVSNGEDTVQFAPTHYVDITATEPTKRRACHAHASQAPGRFYALQEQVTRLRGIESGHRQAESFIRHVQSPDFALPRA